MKLSPIISAFVIVSSAHARCNWNLKSGSNLEKSIPITTEEPGDHNHVPQCFQHRDGGCFMSMLMRDYCRITDVYTWGCGSWQMVPNQWGGYPDDGPYGNDGEIKVGTVTEGTELRIGDWVLEGRMVEDEGERLQGGLAARERRIWIA